MKIAYLYDKTEKELEKDIKDGKDVTIGADVSSILDTINALEVNNPSNPEVVLALIKKECLIVLGKVTEEKENAEDKKRA